MIKTGKSNLITDVPGIQIGNTQDQNLRSGVTVIKPDQPAIASVDVRGGGPGTRETDALNSDCLVDVVHAVVLSGGSAYGLESASGVMAYLAEKKIGFELGGAIIPIVPGAILFDLLNGGDKNWGKYPPYREMGYEAAATVSDTFNLGNVGAGFGGAAGELKGGLGSASIVFDDFGNEITVGALAAVNSSGSLTIPGSPVMWAFPFERENELGGQPNPEIQKPIDLDFGLDVMMGTNTTLATVATDAILTKPQARRIAIMAQDGMARAMRWVHSPYDGDTVFVLATGKKKLSDPDHALAKLGMLAADCVTRAIARGVYEAESLGDKECYRSRYGQFLSNQSGA